MLLRELSPGGIALTLEEFITQFQKTSYGPPKRNSHLSRAKERTRSRRRREGRKMQRRSPQGGIGDIRSSGPGLDLCTEEAGSISDLTGTRSKRGGGGKFRISLGRGVLIMRGFASGSRTSRESLYTSQFCSESETALRKKVYNQMNLAVVNTEKSYNNVCRGIIWLRGEHLPRRVGEIRLLRSMRVNGFLHGFYKRFS